MTETTEPAFKCLCCDQPVTKRGAMPGNPAKALAVLEALGYTREQLLTTHRANLDYTAPGFIDWLEAYP